MKDFFRGNMMKIKNQALKIFLMVCLFASTAVFAMDLQSAKSQGLVGEQLNGYLGVVSSDAGSDVEALVADINNKRKQMYQSIAKKNGTSLDTVELLAGKKAIEKTSTGNYIQSATGWKKK
jgi:uncharacterized protein YdbL (DUF1318 family)